jgi:hypothetical protein
MMADRYDVYGVRKSEGAHTNEGAFSDETAALARLKALGEDPDCLLAEVEKWHNVTTGGLQPISIVAQADRLSGEWRQISGELHSRSRGGEAEALLRDLA